MDRSSQTASLIALRSFLVGDTSFFLHGRDNGDNQFLTVVEIGLQLFAHLTFWGSDVLLHVTVVVHQGQVAVVDVQQLEFVSLDNRNLHVVGGWRQVLQLLLGEDVDGNQVDLGVTVLTGLGGRHVDNLAWSALDDDETVLSQCRTLHWEGQGGSCICNLEVVFFFSHFVLCVCGWCSGDVRNRFCNRRERKTTRKEKSPPQAAEKRRGDEKK